MLSTLNWFYFLVILWNDKTFVKGYTEKLLLYYLNYNVKLDYKQNGQHDNTLFKKKY